MRGTGARAARRLVVAVVLMSGVVGACLGNDYREAPLELDQFEHGWRANVEVGEEFTVDLVANPLYPEVPWQVADFDETILGFAGSEHITAQCTPTEENPCPPAAELGPFLPHTAFEFAGSSKGDSPLRFELVADGEVIGVSEYTISVVDDACAGDIGIAANRCGLGDRDPDLEVAVYEHGSEMSYAVGDTFTVTLAAGAMHPEAPWQVDEIDSSVLALQTVSQDPARSPGDYDTADRDKPWQFLPLWRLTFEAVGVGVSPLSLGVVSDGEPVDIFQLTVTVSNE